VKEMKSNSSAKEKEGPDLKEGGKETEIPRILEM
jgi:hypothetical protein